MRQHQPMDNSCTISKTDAFLMISVALFYDLLQAGIDLITFGFGFTVNWLVSIWAWLTFFLWFKIKGVDFKQWKNTLGFNGGAFMEIIPIPLINSLPVWTASTIMMILRNAPWSQKVLKLSK